MLAGVHGDEYEGPVAIADLLAGLDPATLAGTLIALPVATDGAILRLGKPEALFVLPVREVNVSGGEYDVSKDGTRFLVNEALGEEIASPVNLVLGRLPGGK